MPFFLSHVAVKIRGLCSVYIVYGAKVFREVTHGLFKFSAAPFNSMYFLSLLAVHELHG